MGVRRTWKKGEKRTFCRRLRGKGEGRFIKGCLEKRKMMRMYRRKCKEKIKRITKGSLVETRNTISLKEKRNKI